MAEKGKATRGPSSAETEQLRRKVSSQDLMKFAEGESTSRRTVLLTLDLPRPKLEFGADRRIGGISMPRKRLTITDAEQRERSAKTSVIEKELEKAGVENTALSSGTIIARVSPDQLREIAQSILVKSIAPNRKHELG